jgi:hypothetical protein
MITFQFSRQEDVVSDLIADYTKAWCSHVDIVWPGGKLLGARSNIEGNVPAGVQLRPDGYAPFTKTERVSLMATPDQERHFYDFLAAQVGKPYDKLAVLGFGVGRDWRNPDKWFCSELAMAALEVSAIIHAITSPVNFISPRDVLLLCEAMQPQ